MPLRRAGTVTNTVFVAAPVRSAATRCATSGAGVHPNNGVPGTKASNAAQNWLR
jgi:hypothetical protein